MAGLDPSATRAGVQRVLWLTLALNLGVSAGKIAVGLLSGSLAMLADGYHSLVDGSNNIIGLIVAAYAFRPPDRRSGRPSTTGFPVPCTDRTPGMIKRVTHHILRDYRSTAVMSDSGIATIAISAARQL